MRRALLCLLAALCFGAPTVVAQSMAQGVAQGVGQSVALELAHDEHVPTNGWSSAVYRLRSQVLGQELRLYVGKPPSFARSQLKYPMLLLLDGQYYFDDVQSALCALTASGQVPECVLIGIESKERRVDFTPPEIHLPDVGDRARGDRYLDFLERELLPAAESALRVGKPRVLLGHSHGAMLALYAVAQRPAAFPWAIALDAPTNHEHGFLANDLLRALGGEQRPALRIVSLKVSFGWSDEQWSLLRKAVRPGDLLTHEVVDGEVHESMVARASYRGLQVIFADASALATRELSPLEIDELYRSLAARYGAPLEPPEPLMRRVIEDFLLEGRGAHAGVWLERYVAAYGKPTDYGELAAQVKEISALGEPSETVAGLLALPRATPLEMKPHLGTWKGSTRRGDGPREPLIVRFRVVQGVVQGEIDREQGPLLPLEYVRVRADGALEFGFKNGMRPRGLIMYMEQKPGGALEGEIGFRGMRFTPPHGDEPPTARFELERVDEPAK